MFNVDAAVFQVKIAESSLYPTLNLVASAQQIYGSQSSLAVVQQFSGSVVGQIAVPVYQGGTEYATIRQAKETLTQRRTDLDSARDQAQQTFTQSWGQLEAAKAQIQATTTQVNAAISGTEPPEEDVARRLHHPSSALVPSCASPSSTAG